MKDNGEEVAGLDRETINLEKGAGNREGSQAPLPKWHGEGKT